MLIKKNQDLEKRVKFLEDKQISTEANRNMLYDEKILAEKERDVLGQNHSKLLLSNNPLAKTTFLDKQKMELIQARKDITKLEQDVKTANKRLEKVNELKIKVYDSVKDFGNKLS